MQVSSNGKTRDGYAVEGRYLCCQLFSEPNPEALGPGNPSCRWQVSDHLVPQGSRGSQQREQQHMAQCKHLAMSGCVTIARRALWQKKP